MVYMWIRFAVGLKVHVVDLKSKLTTATEIRRRIINKEAYRELLPRSVFDFIQENDLEKRVRSF